MGKSRYFCESLPENETVAGMHQFSREYHWIRLDGGTIFGLAEVGTEHFGALDNHERISLLSLYSNVNDHLTGAKAKHTQHLKALQIHGVKGTDSVLSAAVSLSKKFAHSQLLPDR